MNKGHSSHSSHRASSPGTPAQHEVPQQKQRDLPAHIAAQLRSAGRPTDTGGQPWKGRNLGEGTSQTHQYYGDDGLTDPAVERALAAFTAGNADEVAVVDALRNARVFAPVVAQLSQAHISAEGLVSDKESDMALVSLQAPDGRKALPVFTCVDYLTRWHRQARPVAASMRKTALSAVEDNNQLVVVNPGQEPTFVMRRPAVWALAQNQPWVPSYRSGEVLAELKHLAEPIGQIIDVHTGAGAGVGSRTGDGRILIGGGSGPELEITLELVPGMNQSQLDETLAIFQRALAASIVISQSVDSVQLKLTS